MNKQETQYKIVNDFLIFKELGSDALGVNYRAGEINPDDRKAEKHSLVTEVYPFLSQNPNVWKKVNILLEGVRKSNISKLYSPEKIIRDENDGKCYLVYPYIKGKTFEQVLDDSTQKDLPINFDLAFSIVFAIADLIDIGSSIVVSGEKSFHGFLTPDNILIDYDGKILLKNYGIYPYLSKDEGILSELEKKYGAWIAPELLRKEKIQAQADIYHLGYITYRILTGKYFSCAPDEDFDSKFSNISFTQHIPPSDKDFLTNIITFFKKTLNPLPSKRFVNIKEIKDFISTQFHIEELSSITFNLAYFMNSLYLEFMEEESKMFVKEMAYAIPVEKKAEPDKSGKNSDQLVEEILTGLDNQKKSRTKFLVPLLVLFVVIVAVSAYIIISQQNKVRQQQEQQAKADEALKRNMDSINQFKAKMEEEYQKKLKNIEQKAATTEEEKKKQEDEIKALKEWQKEETRKALEKQKAEEDRIKKAAEDKKKSDEEIENQRKNEEQKKIAEAKALEEQQKREEQKKAVEETQKVTEGQTVSLNVVTEKPTFLKGENPSFPTSIQKKYKGSRTTVRLVLLVDEKGNVNDLKILTKTQSDLESYIKSAVKKWRFKPAHKDNIKVKVWYPMDINIAF